MLLTYGALDTTELGPVTAADVLVRVDSELEVFDDQLIWSEVGFLRAVGHELIVDEAYGLALEAAQRSGEMDAREATLRRVNLLVVLARGGPQVGGELLRKAHLLVLDHPPMPLDVARAKTVGWQGLPIEELRALRYVKNLLRPLTAATTSDASTPEARALLSSLP